MDATSARQRLEKTDAPISQQTRHAPGVGLGVGSGRAQIFVDFGRGIRKLNPDVKIIGTVWSPPSWMKVNRLITEMSGKVGTRGGRPGTLSPDPWHFSHFANSMV